MARTLRSGLPGHPHHVAHRQGQLDVHLQQRFLNVQNVRRAPLYQLGAVSQQGEVRFRPKGSFQ